MQEPTCKDCTNFRQHYIHFYEERYDPISCGHYVYPRLKHRTVDTFACVHFQQKKSPEQKDAE